MKLFLVEDSPLVLERLSDLLGAIPGTRIVGHAGAADEAIDAILAARPDAVVLDLKLAQGTGFDVLSAVRSRKPGIDFYMLSNFSSEPYREHAARLGAKDFFDKTLEIGRVCDVIARRAAA